MMVRALSSISLKQWMLHRLRTVFMLASIMFGVAVHFAIHTANSTLSNSVKQTVEKLAGKSTLQISAGESGFPEEVLEIVRTTPGVVAAEPVIEVITYTAFPGGETLLILGVDATGDQAIREYQFDEKRSERDNPLVYLARPDSLLLTRSFAQKHDLKLGDPLWLYTSQGRKKFTLRGILTSFEGLDLAVMDVYAAQLIFDRGKNLDRIDLVTDPNGSVENIRQTLAARLTPGLKIDRPITRAQDLENFILTSPQALKLTSFIGLLLAVFIVFNSFRMSVNQRWPEIAVLRAVGVTRPSIRGMFLAEAVAIGVIGSIGGVILGFVLAPAAASNIGGTVPNLYGLSEWPKEQLLRWDFVATSLVLGLVASFLGAWIPARAASRLNPIFALHNVEIREPAAVGSVRTLVGSALVASGLALTFYYPTQYGLSLHYTFAVLIFFGLLLLLPRISQILAHCFRPIMGRVFGTEGLLAIDTIIHSPKRTSAALSALVIGLMFAFSMTAYLNSYKRSLVDWMNREINADLIVKSSTENAQSRNFRLSESLGQKIAQTRGVRRVENLRMAFIPFRDESVPLISIEMKSYLERMMMPFDLPALKEVRTMVPTGGGVLVSRNFALRFNTRQGENLQLETPRGPLVIPIVAVIDDYSSKRGSILMDRELYASYWDDRSVDTFDVILGPGVSHEAAKDEIQKRLAGQQRVFVFTNQEYRNYIMATIARFFSITYLELVVAGFIAILAIVNTLIISVSERQREIGVLRAIGCLPGQVRKLVLLEALSIAIIGVILGALGSIMNTLFLTHTVAMSVAGWTVPFIFPSKLVLISLPVLILIALAGAWWPARFAVQRRVAEAISYE